jgi:RNA polymerase sigma-70 factor (ECF subfamily)
MADGTKTRAEWVAATLARYEQPLMRYTARFCSDGESARDVVQDAFLRLCAADRSAVEGHEAGWLYTVCRNRALDVRRKEGRMDPLPEAKVARIRSDSPGPGDQAAHRQEHRRALEVIGSLPDDQQEAFRLKFQDQLTYREISQVMEVSLGTVSALLTRGLAEVRRQLVSGDLAQEVGR